MSTHVSCGLSPVSHTRPLQVQSRDLINSGTHGFRQDTSHRAISSAARVWQLGQVCAILVSGILKPVFFFLPRSPSVENAVHEHSFRDLSSPESPDGLSPAGSISAHSRPVESLAAYLDTTTSPPHLVLFTADTMGVIKVWDVVKDSTEGPPIWRSTLRDELEGHRTRIDEIVYGKGHLWSGKHSRARPSWPVQLMMFAHPYPSASADETIRLHVYPPSTDTKPKPSPPITHRTGFRAVLPTYLHSKLDSDVFPYLLAGSGDCIRTYDVSSVDEVEFIREVEGHWHDVTHLRIWIRQSADGTRRDVWVVSGSLDGTLRKWKLSGADGLTPLMTLPSLSLSDLVVPPPPMTEERKDTVTNDTSQSDEPLGLTEEEERELAELMGDDV